MSIILYNPIMGHRMMVCDHSIVDSMVNYDSTKQDGGVWLQYGNGFTERRPWYGRQYGSV